MRDTALAQAINPAEFWTINRAAKWLSVHRRTIERRLADGTLTKYTTATGAVRLDAAEVRTLLAPAGGAR